MLFLVTLNFQTHRRVGLWYCQVMGEVMGLTVDVATRRVPESSAQEQRHCV